MNWEKTSNYLGSNDEKLIWMKIHFNSGSRQFRDIWLRERFIVPSGPVNRLVLRDETPCIPASRMSSSKVSST